MRRWRTSVLFAVLAAACLAQSSSQLLTPDVKRIGVRLACLCGSCKNTVADCPMLECHYTKPARAKIIELHKAGKSDDEIVATFVSTEGKRALAVPPAEGFNLLAWLAPIGAILIGLAGIYWFIRRYYMKPVSAGALPEVDPSALERYNAEIEKDLAKLD